MTPRAITPTASRSVVAGAGLSFTYRESAHRIGRWPWRLASGSGLKLETLGLCAAHHTDSTPCFYAAIRVASSWCANWLCRVASDIAFLFCRDSGVRANWFFATPISTPLCRSRPRALQLPVILDRGRWRAFAQLILDRDSERCVGYRRKGQRSTLSFFSIPAARRAAEGCCASPSADGDCGA